MGRNKNKNTSVKKQIILLIVVTILLLSVLTFVLWGLNPAILAPSGTIASRERDLIVLTVSLGVIVVIPVFIMLFVVAWRYREENTSAKYRPDWQGNKIIEAIWWGVPLVIISILGVVAWQTSHELDPFRALDSDKKPVKIQVVALQWRWLFIYPEQKIASLNEMYIPIDTPVNFEITADAPMNSFWIPKLGSQVYAMPGMSTKLHLQGSEIGEFPGSSANISGQGFASMRFKAHVVSPTDYSAWVKTTQRSSAHLDDLLYSEIANPTKDTESKGYILKKADLYDTIIMKYMGTH